MATGVEMHIAEQQRLLEALRAKSSSGALVSELKQRAWHTIASSAHFQDLSNGRAATIEILTQLASKFANLDSFAANVQSRQRAAGAPSTPTGSCKMLCTGGHDVATVGGGMLSVV